MTYNHSRNEWPTTNSAVLHPPDTVGAQHCCLNNPPSPLLCLTQNMKFETNFRRRPKWSLYEAYAVSKVAAHSVACSQTLDVSFHTAASYNTATHRVAQTRIPPKNRAAQIPFRVHTHKSPQQFAASSSSTSSSSSIRSSPFRDRAHTIFFKFIIRASIVKEQ